MSAPRPTPPSWRRYLRFWGTNVEADVRDELAFHLDMRAAEFERQGMPSTEAQQAARERFGDVGAIDAALRTHDRRRANWGDWRDRVRRVGRDLMYAVRSLRRAPGFTIAAVLCLGLGIGATAAVFSIVDALLLRPFPAAHPANLAVVGSVFLGDGTPGDNGYPDYLEMRAQHAVFQDVIAGVWTPVSIRMGDRSERHSLEAVSDNYWDMLGRPMARGRAFTSAEALHGDHLVVISYPFWQTVFHGSDDAIGRTLDIDGIPMTIVGVAPLDIRGLVYTLRFDGWIPATVLRDLNPSAPDPLSRQASSGFKVLARLRAGVTATEAERRLESLAQALRTKFPVEERGLRFVVVPELRARPDMSISGILPRAALVFGLLTVLVLLIACANVASLMLTRVSGRTTELAVRLALGAGQLRLAWQLLAEALVIACLAGGVGIALALFVVDAVSRWGSTMALSAGVPIVLDVHIDWRVLLMTTGVAIMAAVVSGVVPGLRASDVGIGDALKDGARGAAVGSARQRFRVALVGAQIAVSFVLLVAAGLFIRSVERATRSDLGFREDHQLMATVDVSLARYDTLQGRRFYQTLVREASQLPGVRVAALGLTTPLATSHTGVGVYADLPTLTREKGYINVELNSVTPHYFEALGIRLVSGRAFTEHDDSTAPPVMVVNQAMVARLWPGQNPVGQRVRLSPDGPPVQIVGVVGTVTTMFPGERPNVMAYLPFAQRYESAMTLHLLTNGDPGELAGPVRALVSSLDANVAPYGIVTMASHVRDGVAFAPIRFAAAVASGIGLIGLVLALVGLYGVIAYSVAQRGREIGIRMAMGATSSDILLGVLREGMLVTVVGLVAGGALALVVTRALSSLLVAVSVRDPATFAGLAAILSAVTLVACWIPAYRAARVAPIGALRG